MAEPVPFIAALRVWAYIGLHSFGGPAAQIATMHRVLVEEKRWISERRFLDALNYCMVLPGPEAMQLATYVGWLLHGRRGGLAAAALFILPGFVSILGLSVAYALWQDTGVLQALFWGLKAAVLAVVLEAVLRVGRRALAGWFRWGLAGAAFAALFVFAVPFPIVIAAAALTGWLVGRARPAWLAAKAPKPRAGAETASAVDALPVSDASAQALRAPGAAATIRTATAWLAIWLLPIAGLALALGTANLFVQEARFFSFTAIVTFGGAYAVLAYVAQRAVEDFGWLQPGQMLDGLGMAESTPGPLIQVVQFVGFMGAYHGADSLGLPPVVAGIIASVIITWVTFVPSLLFIFTGAPYMEALRSRVGLQHALSSVTAAVVGVILNLAAWFALHVLFAEQRPFDWGPLHMSVPVGTPDVAALALFAACAVALLQLHWNLFLVLGLASAAGLVIRLV